MLLRPVPDRVPLNKRKIAEKLSAGAPNNFCHPSLPQPYIFCTSHNEEEPGWSSWPNPTSTKSQILTKPSLAHQKYVVCPLNTPANPEFLISQGPDADRLTGQPQLASSKTTRGMKEHQLARTRRWRRRLTSQGYSCRLHGEKKKEKVHIATLNYKQSLHTITYTPRISLSLEGTKQSSRRGEPRIAWKSLLLYWSRSTNI